MFRLLLALVQAPQSEATVTAAAAAVPDELVAQLKEGGKMLIPVGTPSLQELKLIKKGEGGRISTSVINFVRFVPLKGKYE